jgi:hypothetical protein
MKMKQVEAELTILLSRCKKDWNVFARDVLGITLDKEQQDILSSVQFNSKTSVVSGTARGKDVVAAVAAMCFHYLTPVFDKDLKLIGNSKTVLSAPTDRQVLGIMMPEIAKLYHNMCVNGFGQIFGGKLTSYDLKMDHREWFLTSFVADEHRPEAWSGWHAVNTMFVMTEASGIADSVFHAIEGNLQGNSRLLIVFNYNRSTGYAAESLLNKQFHSFRLDSLTAPNVLQRRVIIPGQVDFDWVNGRVKDWCMKIPESQFSEIEGDFIWTDENGDAGYYRPNDLFRVKVRGMAPKVSSDVLVPEAWIEAANKRYLEQQAAGFSINKPLRLGADVAGMGTDATCFCHRYGSLVKQFQILKTSGASHMEAAGNIRAILQANTAPAQGDVPKAFIDTIGEGAGTYSRLIELGFENVYSCKFSEAPQYDGQILKDITGQYEFLNMRAYLYWAVRDWLNPANNTGAALPPDKELAQELMQTKWEFQSNGKIKIESKDEIKKRIKRSPDKADSLAMTFYPVEDFDLQKHKSQEEIWSIINSWL